LGCGARAWAAVDRAIECATLANVPVMYDFWPRAERTYEDLLKKMRPGDIHTHVFAQQFPIILADGKINPALAEARARGVILTWGMERVAFWFRNAVPAVKQGFIPDSMSTDLHIGDFKRGQHEQCDVEVSGHGCTARRHHSPVNCQSCDRDPPAGIGHFVGRQRRRHRSSRIDERSLQLHRLRRCPNGWEC